MSQLQNTEARPSDPGINEHHLPLDAGIRFRPVGPGSPSRTSSRRTSFSDGPIIAPSSLTSRIRRQLSSVPADERTARGTRPGLPVVVRTMTARRWRPLPPGAGCTRAGREREPVTGIEMADCRRARHRALLLLAALHRAREIAGLAATRWSPRRRRWRGARRYRRQSRGRGRRLGSRFTRRRRQPWRASRRTVPGRPLGLRGRGRRSRVLRYHRAYGRRLGARRRCGRHIRSCSGIGKGGRLRLRFRTIDQRERHRGADVELRRDAAREGPHRHRALRAPRRRRSRRARPAGRRACRRPRG